MSTKLTKAMHRLLSEAATTPAMFAYIRETPTINALAKRRLITRNSDGFTISITNAGRAALENQP